MEALDGLIQAGKWEQAIAKCAQLGFKPDYVLKHEWLSFETATIDLDRLAQLQRIEDPEWVTTALLALADDQDVRNEVLEAALPLASTSSTVWCQSLPALAPAMAADQDQTDLDQLCSDREDVRLAVESLRRAKTMEQLAESYSTLYGSSSSGKGGRHSAVTAEQGDEEAWDIDVTDDLEDPDPADRPRLFDWIHASQLDNALLLAASADERLFTLYRRHPTLFADRWTLLDAVPDWSIANFVTILKIAPDGSEDAPSFTPAWYEEPVSLDALDASSLSQRIESIINRLADSGFVASARELAQTASSTGIQGLDEIGEELTLMERYIYRGLPAQPSSSSAAPASDQGPMSLAEWRTTSPDDKVRAYLSLSSPQSVVEDLRSLVVPFLQVEESRAERAGESAGDLVQQTITTLVLEWAQSGEVEDFDRIHRVMDASKPTERTRLVKNDLLLARLALAVVYGTKHGNGELLELQSKIFECLPAFPDAGIVDSVQTSVFGLDQSSPASILEQTSTWDQAAVSRALDTLDVHLSSAEILFRYDVPVALQSFLTWHDNLKEQINIAQRMVRGDGFDSEDEWETLIGDMLALRGDGSSDDIKRPLWLVDEHKLWRIYLSALLRSSHFKLAQRMFVDSPLTGEEQEQLVLDTSREFYDNAQEGNLHRGSMKEAFDVLSVVPLSPAVAYEREFIEATSKLCSFRLPSPLAPIEIRLSKDRLSFFARLLSTNDDAYKHPDMLLDLARKLGYREDIDAQARLLAMMVDTAIQSADYRNAAELCEKMIKFGGASEVAWRSCYQLAKTEDYEDVDERLALLGRAMLSCPKEQITTLLSLWVKLEPRRSTSDVAAATRNEEQHPTRSIQSLFGGLAAAARPSAVSPTRSNNVTQDHQHQQQQQPMHDAYSRAPQNVRTAVPPSFAPPSLRHAVETGKGATEGIRKGISSGLTRGVGWLIGADEREFQP